MKRFLCILCGCVPVLSAWPQNIIVTTAGTTQSGALASSLSIPAGIIAMWSGTLALVPSGWHLCDGTDGTPDLRDKFIKGWADGVDPGGTGGAATHTHTNHVYTPAGSVSAPTFTGDALGTHTHGAGSFTNAVPLFTGSALGTHTHTAGSLTNLVPTFAGSALGTHSHTAGTYTNVVPAFTGNAFSSVINHTHTVTITDPGHAHVQAVNSGTTGGTSGYTPDTSTSTTTVSGYTTGVTNTGITASSANPAGGVASITPAGTNAWASGMSGSSSSDSAGTPAGSNTWPSGMSGASGATSGGTPAGNNAWQSGMSGTSAATSGGTPAGTVSAPSFTGALNSAAFAHDAASNEPPYFKLAYIIKL